MSNGIFDYDSGVAVKTREKTEETDFERELEYNNLIEQRREEKRRKELEEYEKSKLEAKRQKAERRKTLIKIFDITVCFAMLMLISYRYATIDAKFKEKENLKKELASVQKENEQLKVNIEKQMNLNAIEQEAKEKLGMQKLDNNQKIYVNLNKSDYIEPAQTVSNKEETSSSQMIEETWWSKMLKDLFKIEK